MKHQFIFQHIISVVTTQIKSDETSDISGKDDAQQPTYILTNINNLIEALPTDEDLRRAYFWTSHQLGGCARDEMVKCREVIHLVTFGRFLTWLYFAGKRKKIFTLTFIMESCVERQIIDEGF